MKRYKILLLVALTGVFSSCKDTMGLEEKSHKEIGNSTSLTSTNSVSATIIGNIGGGNRAFVFTHDDVAKKGYKLDLSQLKFSENNKDIPIYLYAFHDEHDNHYVSNLIEAKADYDETAHKFSIKDCKIAFAKIRKPDVGNPGEFTYEDIPSNTTLTIDSANPIYITGIIGGYKDSEASERPNHEPMIFMPGASNTLYPVDQNMIKSSSILGDKDFVIPVALKLTALYGDRPIALASGGASASSSTVGNVSIRTFGDIFQLMGNLLAFQIENNTNKPVEKISFQTNVFTRNGIYDMAHCQGSFDNPSDSHRLIPVNKVGTTPFHLYWADNRTATISSDGVATIHYNTYLDGITHAIFHDAFGNPYRGQGLPKLYTMSYALSPEVPVNTTKTYVTWVMGRTLNLKESATSDLMPSDYDLTAYQLCNTLYYNVTLSGAPAEDTRYYKFESSKSDASKLYSLPILKQPNASYVLPIKVSNNLANNDLIFSEIYYGQSTNSAGGAVSGTTGQQSWYNESAVQIYNPTNHDINLRNYFLARITSTNEDNRPFFLTSYYAVHTDYLRDIRKALLMPLDFIRFRSGQIAVPRSQVKNYGRPYSPGIFHNDPPYLVEAPLTFYTNFDITSANGGDPFPQTDQSTSKFYRYGSVLTPFNLSPKSYNQLYKMTTNVGGRDVEDLAIQPGKNIVYAAARPWNYYINYVYQNYDNAASPIVKLFTEDHSMGGFYNQDAEYQHQDIVNGSNFKLPEQKCNFVIFVNDAFMWEHGFHTSETSSGVEKLKYDNYYSYLDGEWEFFNKDPFSFGICGPRNAGGAWDKFNKYYNLKGGYGYRANDPEGTEATTNNAGIMQIQPRDILALIKMEKQTILEEHGNVVTRYLPRIVDVVGGYPYDYKKQFKYISSGAISPSFYSNKTSTYGDKVPFISYWMVRDNKKPYARGKDFQESDWNVYSRETMQGAYEQFGKWKADYSTFNYGTVVTGR